MINSLQVFVGPDDVFSTMKAFKQLGYDIQGAETVWVPLPESQKQLDGSSERAKTLLRVKDELEAEETVTGVYSNATVVS